MSFKVHIATHRFCTDLLKPKTTNKSTCRILSLNSRQLQAQQTENIF